MLRYLTCHVTQSRPLVLTWTSSVSVRTDQSQQVFLSPFKQRQPMCIHTIRFCS